MSHTLLRCIGLFYFMLGNIDPKFRSSLHSIQLVAVVRTELMETYPVGEILTPFMTDIRQLESVNFNGTVVTVLPYHSCTFVSGH